MYRLLALLALLTTGLTPLATVHCEMVAGPVGHASSAASGTGSAAAEHHATHDGHGRTDHGRHHAASDASGPPEGAERRAASDAPEPHTDCRVAMACGMSMLRSVDAPTVGPPLPTAAGPEHAAVPALTVASAPADPPPPRRSI